MHLHRQAGVPITGCAERAQVTHQIPASFRSGKLKIDSQRGAVPGVVAESALEPIPLHDFVAQGVIDSDVFGQAVFISLAPMRTTELNECLLLKVVVCQVMAEKALAITPVCGPTNNPMDAENRIPDVVHIGNRAGEIPVPKLPFRNRITILIARGFANVILVKIEDDMALILRPAPSVEREPSLEVAPDVFNGHSAFKPPVSQVHNRNRLWWLSVRLCSENFVYQSPSSIQVLCLQLGPLPIPLMALLSCTNPGRSVSMANEEVTHPFIPLARKLEGSPVWEMGPLTVQLWIWLLLKAVWKPEGFTLKNGIHLERGQLWTTYGRMSEALKTRKGQGYTRPAIRTLRDVVSRLIDARMIAVLATHQGLLITICNYEEYNPTDFDSRTVSRTVSRSIDATEEQRKEQRVQEQLPLDTPYPKWAYEVLEDWKSVHELPAKTTEKACLEAFLELQRKEGKTPETIKRVCSFVVRNKVPLYIQSPVKLLRLNRAKDQQTFEMYEWELEQKAPPKRRRERKTLQQIREEKARAQNARD